MHEQFTQAMCIAYKSKYFRDPARGKGRDRGDGIVSPSPSANHGFAADNRLSVDNTLRFPHLNQIIYETYLVYEEMRFHTNNENECKPTKQMW